MGTRNLSIAALGGEGLEQAGANETGVDPPVDHRVDHAVLGVLKREHVQRAGVDAGGLDLEHLRRVGGEEVGVGGTDAFAAQVGESAQSLRSI